MKPKQRVDVERFLEEHRRIEAILQELDDRLAKCDRPPQEIVRLLQELPLHLEAHFAFEEAERYFDEGMLRAPHLQPRADAILAQHGPIVEAAKAFAAKAVKPNMGSLEWYSWVRAEYQALKDDLHRHEHEENELVQEAYMGDLGAHD